MEWELPTRVVDLFIEFRNISNGRRLPCGNGLLGALAAFGLRAIDASEKAEMRDLAMRGGDYTPNEKMALLDYCQSDVDTTMDLFREMLPHIDMPRALL